VSATMAHQAAPMVAMAIWVHSCGKCLYQACTVLCRYSWVERRPMGRLQATVGGARMWRRLGVVAVVLGQVSEAGPAVSAGGAPHHPHRRQCDLMRHIPLGVPVEI
jgi:hypothetical protein